MLTLPENQTRAAQAYVFVPFTVSMEELQQPGDEGFPLLFAHLEKHGLKPVGDPFYNYRRINMAETLDVEAGIAVEAVGPKDGRVRNGLLPGGRFVTLDWHGHPDKLEPVTGLLIGWLKLTQQPLDVEEKADGDHFACRLEIYHSNPDEVPDLEQWVTTLAFKLAD